MSRRSRAREVALQMLFEDDVNPRTSLDETKQFLAARLHAPDLEEFCLALIQGVRRNQDELDELLGKSAENWSLDRMAATDRNVLRLGAFEILYTETPDRAAINEAVELAKRFGSANSAPFVNGILDRVLHHKDTPPTG
jgi:N utilization substance protein B